VSGVQPNLGCSAAVAGPDQTAVGTVVQLSGAGATRRTYRRCNDTSHRSRTRIRSTTSPAPARMIASWYGPGGPARCAALAAKRSCENAALELGAMGSLFDVPLLETARAEAEIYYEELAAALSGPDHQADPRNFTADCRYRRPVEYGQVSGAVRGGARIAAGPVHPTAVSPRWEPRMHQSLLSSHIRSRDDLDLFTRLLVVMTAIRAAPPPSRSERCRRSRSARIRSGGNVPARDRGWGSGQLLQSSAKLRRGVRGRPRVRMEPRRASPRSLLRISVAFGGARFGGWEERFLLPVLSAISSAAYPGWQAARATSRGGSPSSGRDQLRVPCSAQPVDSDDEPCARRRLRDPPAPSSTPSPRSSHHGEAELENPPRDLQPAPSAGSASRWRIGSRRAGHRKIDH